jgi:GT2 family glycosyltransferase
MIGIISATRKTEEEFWTDSALGVSLRRLSFDPRIDARVTFRNQRGLPDVYNEAISAAGSEEILVFVHDDVWIDDFFLSERVLKGLGRFDVIGVAGNRRRLPGQTGWAFVDDKFTWDDKANLSGSVAHGLGPFGLIGHFGSVPADCELLDGLFLAVKKSTLSVHGLMFDSRFDFHFYDLDFCRSARSRGLRLGTWPICLTHQSGGSFGTEQWCAAYRSYIDKWRE